MMPLAAAADGGTNNLLAAGEERAVAVPGMDNVMRVFLPTNYVPERKWPAIFYYHALNHTPETGLLRSFTGSRDYILVALPYLSDGMSDATPQLREAALQREIAGFRAGRAWMAAHAAVDDGRVFVAGASKGGWMTSQVGEREMSRLAGLIVILSGRVPYAEQGAMTATLRGKPIYIGVGETDPNLIPGIEAREYYRRAGARVTFEIFEGVGHAVPVRPVRLAQWLEANGRYGASAVQAEVAALKESFREQSARVAAEKDPAAKYAQLTDVLQNPLLTLCSPGSVPGIESQLAALRSQLPAQAAEWRAEQTFCGILWRAMNLRRLEDQKAVRDDLKTLSETLPDTRYGKLAAEMQARVAAAYEKSLEATRRAADASKAAAPATPAVVAPAFPTLGPARPPIMRQKGNKITFE